MATLKQAKKILELIDQAELSTEQLQKLIPYLSDLMQVDLDTIKRNAFRKACGLRPVEMKFMLREIFTLEDLVLDFGKSIGDRIVKSISSKGAECHFSSNRFGSNRFDSNSFGKIVLDDDFSVIGQISVNKGDANIKRLIIELKSFQFEETSRIYDRLIPDILKIAAQLD